MHEKVYVKRWNPNLFFDKTVPKKLYIGYIYFV